MIETLHSALLYPVLAISIWYAIRYSSFEENSMQRALFFHVIYASILSIIWIYLGIILVRSIVPTHLDYMKNSWPARFFGGYLFYTLFVIFFYALNYYQSLKDKIRKEAELRALVREAELHAL